MAFPAYVPTQTVTVGGAMVLESSTLLKVSAKVKSSRSLIWAETGYRLESSITPEVSELGTEVSFILPRTDRAGWKDAKTNQLIDVSAPGAYSHRYTVTLSFIAANNSRIGSDYTIGPFVVDSDDPIDLDKLVPAGTVAGDVVSIPDSWSALVAAAQAAAEEAAESLGDVIPTVAAAVADPDDPLGVSAKIAEVVSDEVAEIALVRDSNLADLPSKPAARSSLGLGTAATQPTTAFDPAGSAAAVQAQVNALTPSGAFRGAYSNATNYVQGDQVTYNGVVYAAPSAIASGGTAPGAGGSAWVALPSGTDLKARGDIGMINQVISFVASSPLDNRVDTSTITSSAPSDRRFICQRAMPQGKVESVTVHARFAVNPFSVELWESDGTTLTRKAVVTQALVVGVNTIPLSWYINDPSKTYYLGVQSGGASNISLNPSGSPVNPWWTNTDETSTSLTISGMTANTSLSIYIKVDALVARPASTTRPPTIVVAESGGDFTTIQAACDAAPDTVTQQVRIEIYPKANGATYGRFSHVGFPFQTGSSALTRTRYLDMIGMGRVVVKDDTGDYRTPPAEIRTVGTIRNIDFIATHDTPFSDPVEAALARRSYAVHMDFGGYQNVLFENCGFYSKHGPALGVGLHQDERIILRRCIVETIADPSFGGLANYGALFAHSSSVSGITNQGIILDDVRVDAPIGVPTDSAHGGPDGGCAIWFSVAGAFVGSSMFVQANRVSARGPVGGDTVIRDSRITLDSKSWGNDATELNA